MLKCPRTYMPPWAAPLRCQPAGTTGPSLTVPTCSAACWRACPTRRVMEARRQAPKPVLFFGFFGWVFFFDFVRLAVRVLRARIGHTCGEPNEIELTTTHGVFHRPFAGRGHLALLRTLRRRPGLLPVRWQHQRLNQTRMWAVGVVLFARLLACAYEALPRRCDARSNEPTRKRN